MKAFRLGIALISAFGSMTAAAQAPAVTSSARYTGPIVDVHLHALPATVNGPAPNAICVGPVADIRYDPKTPWPTYFGARMAKPPCAEAIQGPATDQEVMNQSIAQLTEYNVKGVLSGEPSLMRQWQEAAPGRLLLSKSVDVGSGEPTVEQLTKEHRAGGFAVLGEIGSQYAGVMVNDPRFAPYWKFAEDNDIAVGVHLGVGPPGTQMLIPPYRLQTPRLLEEVLARHPRLRIYAMHAGYPFIDDLKAMLYAYPQLHVDTGVLQMALPRQEYHAFLKELVDAGYVDRIMFGSDQMNWPGLIGEGIDAINDASFLTLDQKKAILHDNAVRFFRLDPRQW